LLSKVGISPLSIMTLNKSHYSCNGAHIDGINNTIGHVIVRTLFS
jgi:hypothetical protein